MKRKLFEGVVIWCREDLREPVFIQPYRVIFESPGELDVYKVLCTITNLRSDVRDKDAQVRVIIRQIECHAVGLQEIIVPMSFLL